MTFDARRGRRVLLSARSWAVGQLEDATTAVQSLASPSVGWLPVLAGTSVFGLLAVVLADGLSRSGHTGGEALFWVGLLSIVIPIAWRLLSAPASRAERIALVGLAGTALYLVKVARDPFEFTFGDEWVHVHNANEILRTHLLLSENPILSASPSYPGLETVTTALVSLSGVSTFAAGVVIIGIARLLMMVALFLLFEHVSGSARAAGVASLLYTGAPNFLFWSAQFSYESLALPAAVVVVWGVAQWMSGLQAATRSAWATAIVLLTIAIVITHHMTTYALVAFLLAAWLLHGRLSPRGSGSSPLPFVIVAVGATAAWLTFVASDTVGYLNPVFTTAIESVVETVRQESAPRRLFSSDVGVVAPIWERAVGLSSLALIALGLPFGLLAVWRKYRRDTIAVLFALGGCAYLGVFVLRLIPGAWEVANRATEFLFVGGAFVLALTGLERWSPHRARWLGRAAATVAVGVIFAGGVIAGWPRDLRLAQTYRVAVNNTTIEPQGLAAAQWSDVRLPRGRFAGDRSNGRLLLAHGGHFVRVSGHAWVSTVIRGPDVPAWTIRGLVKDRIRYIVIDRRFVSDNPMSGYFFATSTSPAIRRLLYPPASYRKFDRLGGTSRVFDSGHIVVYDVKESLARARRR